MERYTRNDVKNRNEDPDMNRQKATGDSEQWEKSTQGNRDQKGNPSSGIPKEGASENKYADLDQDEDQE